MNPIKSAQIEINGDREKESPTWNSYWIIECMNDASLAPTSCTSWIQKPVVSLNEVLEPR